MPSQLALSATPKKARTLRSCFHLVFRSGDHAALHQLCDRHLGEYVDLGRERESIRRAGLVGDSAPSAPARSGFRPQGMLPGHDTSPEAHPVMTTPPPPCTPAPSAPPSTSCAPAPAPSPSSPPSTGTATSPGAASSGSCPCAEVLSDWFWPAGARAPRSPGSSSIVSSTLGWCRRRSRRFRWNPDARGAVTRW